MTEVQLKLVKTKKYQMELAEDRVQDGVSMTPAEAEEVAYFRQLVEAKAARQIMLQRIMTELADLEEISSAA